MDHFKQTIKRLLAIKETGLILIERSPHSAMTIFTPQGLDSGAISCKQYKQLQKIYNLINYTPALHVWMSTSVEECLLRIKKRNRSCENNIPEKYVQQLHEYHLNMKSVMNMVTVNGDGDQETILSDSLHLMKHLLGRQTHHVTVLISTDFFWVLTYVRTYF